MAAVLNTVISDDDVPTNTVVDVNLSVTGLAAAVAPVVNDVVVSGSALLSDGTQLDGIDLPIKVTKPGKAAQTVVSYALQVVSGSATFTQVSPGVFRATLTA